MGSGIFVIIIKSVLNPTAEMYSGSTADKVKAA